MDNERAQLADTDGGARMHRTHLGLTIEQYEILTDMSTQMLATHRLNERLSLALDTIKAGLGYARGAIALIDDRSRALRVRMAVGFEDNQAVERIETPLDAAAAGLSVIFEGRPTWITRSGEYIPLLDQVPDSEDILALPLFGLPSIVEKLDGEFARRQLGDAKYWEPETMCVGALYIAASRAKFQPDMISPLQQFADRIGVITASAIEIERLIETVATLKRERQWVESIMKSVADPIVLTNPDNEILLQNKRAEELFSGWDNGSDGKRQALKMNDLLFSAYLSSGAVDSAEVLGRDLTLVDPIEGSEIHFEVVSTPALTELGEGIGLVSVFRDVTDLQQANEELARNLGRLKQAEANARRERDRLNLIIENVGHPVVVTDADGTFILFNRRAALLFEPEQALSEKAALLTSQADPTASRALAAVRANSVKLTSFISGLASEKRSGRQEEIELRDPETGEVLPMEITSVEVRDAAGQVTAVVSVLHDLSQVRELERRRVEQKLFESEKLAAVGTLAASIAHEVNNPLEAIKNSLYLLQSNRDETSSGRFLGIAIKETERVSNIIRQMLGFARRSGGVEWIDANQLVQDTVALVERRLHHAGIKLIRKLDDTLPRVHCYPDQLRQVFLNLILNAQQSIEGSGIIEIETSQAGTATEPFVVLEVTDSGPGISGDDLLRIFEPFYSTRKDGTGLGLWISQNIMRQHGGSLEVSSCANQGAKFRVVLPVDSPSLIGVGSK